MRILWVTEGLTGHDRRFTAVLAGAGHDVRYLAMDAATHPGSLPEGVSWDAWGARPDANARTPQGAAALLPAFNAVLERVRPDVVHAGPVTTAAYLAALAGARPLVVMSWGSDLLVDAGRSHLGAEAARAALGAADLFVCDADAVLRRARELASVPAERVVQLPWGTDPSRFAPAAEPSPLRAQLGFAGDDFVVLCTRSWERVYGIDTLIEGFRWAWRQDPRLRLVLLGGGSLAEEVERSIVQGGLTGAVRRPGAVAHHELPDWFRMADLYASSAHSDGTSVSLLEAMASGLPVMVTDIPSNREWVVAGDNGWLAPPGEPIALGEVLLAAASLDPESRRAIGRRNRGVVESRADWSSNSRRLLEAYARLKTAETGSGAR